LKLYEGLFLIDPNQATKDWPGIEKHIHDVLTRHGAEIAYSEKWPDRRLAYEIKGCKKGTYYLTYFNAPPNAINNARDDFLLGERVLRFLLISDDGLAEEMQRRRNKEIEAPPTDIFGEERFGYRGRSWSDRHRPGEKPRESAADEEGDRTREAEGGEGEADAAAEGEE
jgi:small subunit ribosomal protein S6